MHNAADSGLAMPAPPRVSLAASNGKQALVFSGEWTVLTVGAMESILRGMAADSGRCAFDIRNITRLDTAGALVLQRMAFVCHGEGWRSAVIVEDAHHLDLLNNVAGSARLAVSTGPAAGPWLRFLNELGQEIIAEFRMVGELMSFFGHYLTTLFFSLLRPARLRITSLVFHMEQVGLAAVPIVALLSFLIGAVVAYMGAMQLARFGAQIFVVNLVVVTVLRELSVLLTTILVAGRSGSAFTAQIGAMVVNEEVAAMRTMGLDPMELLVLPRVLALTFMLPALVFLSDIMGLLGGGVAVWMNMGMSPASFAARVQESLELNNFLVGLIKAPFFAVTIGIVGCFQGFQVTGSAESVGRLTTHAVVQSIFLVIVVDALFAVFFSAVGF